MSDKKKKETNPQYVKKTITYCLKCGKKTNKENIKEVELKNKIGQQKSTCVVCDSKKSTFLESIKPINPIKSKN